jgi:ABC-type sugar transport system ATPase subunit
MSGVVVCGLSKSYGQVRALCGIDLVVEPGDFAVLLGPSGCGKSTLLNAIAGLDDIDAGTVAIGSVEVTQREPSERGIAMVFQSYALYPTMTVRRNLSFGLRVRSVPKAEIKRRVAWVSELLQIGGMLDRKPSQLSGGQRQRIAIGRALVQQAKVFLLDEPLSNLDAKLRTEMRVELKRLHPSLAATIIYVTHDQIEAMTPATRIAVMRAGRIEQYASPDVLYERPETLFVAGFVGSPGMNFSPARSAAHRCRWRGSKPTRSRWTDIPSAARSMTVARSFSASDPSMCRWRTKRRAGRSSKRRPCSSSRWAPTRSGGSNTGHNASRPACHRGARERFRERCVSRSTSVRFRCSIRRPSSGYNSRSPYRQPSPAFPGLTGGSRIIDVRLNIERQKAALALGLSWCMGAYYEKAIARSRV